MEAAALRMACGESVVDGAVARGVLDKAGTIWTASGCQPW
jgi:hypothetical protein